MRALAQPRGPQNLSLVDLGYVQANLDDAWQACGAGVNHSFHDAAGNPLVNERAFPNIQAMTALGASLGIQPGIYMNNCMCSENMFTDPAQIKGVVVFCAFLLSFFSLGNIGAAILLPILYGTDDTLGDFCIQSLIFGYYCN